MRKIPMLLGILAILVPLVILGGCGGGASNWASRPHISVENATCTYVSPGPGVIGTSPPGMRYTYSFPGTHGEVTHCLDLRGPSATAFRCAGCYHGVREWKEDEYGRKHWIKETVTFDEGGTHTVILELEFDAYSRVSLCTATLDGTVCRLSIPPGGGAHC